MADRDDLVRFLPESDPHPLSPPGDAPHWRVMIVDDDADVHTTTKYALQGLTVHGRALAFLDAYSAKECITLLRQQPDVAVILLDVVMETEDAGLRAVETIRDELHLPNVRIILRTGQPGYAPELEVVARYDINDYKAKGELTRVKLFTAVTSAIRAYDQLQRMDENRHGLEKVVAACTRFVGLDGLGAFAEGVILQITSLLGLQSRGLICVARTQVSGQRIEYKVIAAAGPFAGLIDRSMVEISNERARDRLASCLQRRRTLIDDQSLTLFCPGNRNNDFAAYVECSPNLRSVDRELIEAFCTNIGLCGDNMGMIENLATYAFTDALTGLPNQNAFLDQIEKETEAADQVVAVLNLDEFAETNDLLGHAYGDQVLKRMAEILKLQLEGRARVARIGADSFAVCGPQAVVNPDHLQGLFRPHFVVDDVDFPISFSLGLVRRDDFADAMGIDLLRYASIALKRAKRHGHGQSAYYTAEVSRKTLKAARLLHELRQALDLNQFYLVFEPHVQLKTGQVVGLEALIRWQSPLGEDVDREQFIPVAESSGLIVDIGDWVLRSALQALKQIQAAGVQGLRLAINVSAVEFRQPDFLKRLDEALEEAGVSPSSLELEITESVTLLEMDLVRRQLQALRDRQISVAIDDFGKGYSSLSYLDELPADKLKIDRAFVQALDSGQSGAHIAQMIITLAQAMNLSVLAEGVENESQARQLAASGCDEAQGYFYARPMRLEELIPWLQAWCVEHSAGSTPP